LQTDRWTIHTTSVRLAPTNTIHAQTEAYIPLPDIPPETNSPPHPHSPRDNSQGSQPGNPAPPL